MSLDGGNGGSFKKHAVLLDTRNGLKYLPPVGIGYFLSPLWSDMDLDGTLGSCSPSVFS